MGSRIATVFGIILIVLIVNSCFAQLNYSPNWGKRSGSLNQLDFGNSAGTSLNSNGINSDSSLHFGGGHGATNANGNNCKPSIDSLMLIYRMIQVEAEKLDECLQK